MKKAKSFLAALSLYALPVVVAAQDDSTISNLLDNIQDWVNTLIPIIIGIALLFFLWGLAKYLLAGGDEESRKEGRQLMIYGVITLFVMVAVWGLVSFLANTLGIDTGAAETPDAPGVPEGGD